MSTVRDGGPAFPVECFYPGDGSAVRGTQTSGHTGWEMGMTLRDYFAAKAMQGDCVRNEWGKHDLEDLASWAYLVADAMLKAREVQS